MPKEIDLAYVGFAKLTAKLAAKGAKNPGALAAAIGRKKYGAKKFNKAAATGTSLKPKKRGKKKPANVSLATPAYLTDDIELGKFGSEWKHGYIPQNPAAVALKNHKRPGGGGGGSSVAGKRSAKSKISKASSKVNLPGKNSALPAGQRVTAHEVTSGNSNFGEIRHAETGQVLASGFKSKQAATLAANKHNAKAVVHNAGPNEAQKRGGGISNVGDRVHVGTDMRYHGRGTIESKTNDGNFIVKMDNGKRGKVAPDQVHVSKDEALAQQKAKFGSGSLGDLGGNVAARKTAGRALSADKKVTAHEVTRGNNNVGELRTADGKIVGPEFKSQRSAQIAATKHNRTVSPSSFGNTGSEQTASAERMAAAGTVVTENGMRKRAVPNAALEKESPAQLQKIAGSSFYSSDTRARAASLAAGKKASKEKALRTEKPKAVEMLRPANPDKGRTSSPYISKKRV